MLIKADKYYLDNLREIELFGSYDEDPRPRYKDGTPARSKFITQVFETYNIAAGEFPITTFRPTAIKTGIKEIFWIYQKQSGNLEDAREMGVHWWNSWDIGDGTIGQRYGQTVREHELLNDTLSSLKEDPFGRRHIMSLWQVYDLRSTPGLFPCAYETIWSCRRDGGEIYLDMTLVQRSNDYIMAGYINKIQYVALQMMVAGHLGYKVGKFAHLVQNLHIYDRHEDAMWELITLGMKQEEEGTPQVQPKLILKENKNFFDYTIDDFEVQDMPQIPKLQSPLELAI